MTFLVVTSGLLGLAPAADGRTDAMLDGARATGPPAHADLDPAGVRPADGGDDRRGGTDAVGRIANAVEDVPGSATHFSWAHETVGLVNATGSVGPNVLLIAGIAGRDDDVLDNDVRREIYEAVTASPGTHLAALADAAGISWSTARYHGRVLAESGLVTAAKIRGRHRLYPAEVDDPELAAALDEDATAAVLAALSRLEPVGVSSLAEAADIAPSTASYHLQRLEADGLVEREREGRTVLARLEPPVRDALADGTDASEE